MNVLEINTLVLAYLGDSVYELRIRDYLIKEGISNVNDLQRESLKYVSAKSQAMWLHQLIENDILLEDEINVMKRARNSKNNHQPKSCDVVTYKLATGLEAVIGYLYFTNNINRIDIIMNFILGGKEK